MRYSRRCTSNGFRAAGPRCGGFSSVMISPIKKSLCAAERHRKDVARARRDWIQQQGFLDTTRLVFIDETAITTNMVRVRGRWCRHLIMAQRSDKGDGFPFSLRDMTDQPLAARAAAPDTDHIRGDRRLVDKDQPRRIKEPLLLNPTSARSRYV